MAGKTKLSKYPDTYLAIDGPDNAQIIVPRFMVPILEQDLDSLLVKEELKVVEAKSLTVAHKKSAPCTTIAGLIHIPADPDFTDQERLTLHAEICALQDRLGISYQDAAHRLYMTEIEKLKLADANKKFYSYFDRSVTKGLEGIAERHGDNE